MMSLWGMACLPGPPPTRCHRMLACRPVQLAPPLPPLPAPQAVPLNRYVLDYYHHGQKSALIEANGLREGDAWQVRHAWE